ncbi:putative ABC transporter permease [Adlercreutzia agrestimuris]|uniref:putative ABC transporter permease n=1 Tax=Adlercreutzia agrestimuris TaxID=2941324 RepID=UPI00203FD154|nr:putative ABC transporter permease [Adlercreutzia agrestimuris]
MLFSIISLVATILIAIFVFWCISAFWSWLGRGKQVRRVYDQDLISADIKAKIQEIDAIKAAQKLNKGNRRAVVRLNRRQRSEVQKAERQVRDEFLNHLRLGWYQIVMVFFIGSVLGLLLEEAWMFVTAGVTESRVGLVWGPFSPLYGVGAVLLTLVTFKLRQMHASGLVVFVVSMIVGGLLEQLTGWGMETFFGAVSWDYIAGGIPGAITKWVAVPFLFFWGILGYVWYKLIMPDLLWALGVPTTRRKAIFVTLLSIYLVADIFMTIMCFERRAERDEGIPPANAFEAWIDENFNNNFMSEHFQNMVIGGQD